MTQRSADEILAALGHEWAPDDTGLDEPTRLIHVPTRISFVHVAGGEYSMGLSDDDIEAASEIIDWTSGVARWVETMSRSCRPVRTVRVKPFLCARDLLVGDDLARLRRGPGRIENLPRSDARALAHAHGFRLPSEAEWEFLARDGGSHSFILDLGSRFDEINYDESLLRSRFAVRELFVEQWVEDDWHSSYAGAPGDSAPWMSGDPAGVQRGGFLLAGVQDRSELLWALAANRFRSERGCWTRFAHDLPV